MGTFVRGDPWGDSVVRMSGTVIPGGQRTPAELADTITVKQDGETVMQAVNTLNFSGATVAEDGHGQASVTISGGGGSIHTDDTLTGSGTSGSPLGVDTTNLAGDIAVAVDGTSIAGNGKTGTPLHTVAGGTPVATDGTTITGNGTSGSPPSTS